MIGSSIPQACLQFTSVFQTMRIEMAVALFIGVVIGIVAARLHK